MDPKVPGSRPGRPTKSLVRGIKIILLDSDVANHVAKAVNSLGLSFDSPLKSTLRVASAALAR